MLDKIMRLAFALFAATMILTYPVIVTADEPIKDQTYSAKQLKGDDILEALLNQTMNGAYNLSEDGKPTRFFTEYHSENGEALYEENGEMARGIWTIRRHHLCYEYESGTLTGGCFKVFLQGNCYYFFSQNIPKEYLAIEDNYWTARAVRSGETPSCDPGVS